MNRELQQNLEGSTCRLNLEIMFFCRWGIDPFSKNGGGDFNLNVTLVWQARADGLSAAITEKRRWIDYLLKDKTPYTEEVKTEYELTLERIQHPVYKVDLELRKLKRCL